MNSKIILYDLPSKAPCKCWSLNPWKTRALLNYKVLQYETQWVEYPDIKPLFEKHITANSEGAEYTIPTVMFQDGTYMQDSKEIARHIEKLYPNPTVHLNSDYLAKVEAIMPELMAAVMPEFIPKVPKRLLNEASVPYWYKTREARFGKSLDRVEEEMGGDTAWMNAAPWVQKITALLREQSNGPFFEGNQVTYVDFVVAGLVRFMERIGDDTFGKLLEASGDKEVLLAHYKACEPWLTRDDH